MLLHRSIFVVGLFATTVFASAQARPFRQHHYCLWSQRHARPLRPYEEPSANPAAACGGTAALAVGGLGLLTRLRRI